MALAKLNRKPIGKMTENYAENKSKGQQDVTEDGGIEWMAA